MAEQVLTVFEAHAGRPQATSDVWCHFRDEVTPRAKPRPALVLAVFGRAAAQAAHLGSRDA